MDVQGQRLLDYQMQELEKYRMAIKTMGQDILSLRQQIRELEVHCGPLKSNVICFTESQCSEERKKNSQTYMHGLSVILQMKIVQVLFFW